MTIMKTRKVRGYGLLLGILVIAFASCSKNKDVAAPTTKIYTDSLMLPFMGSHFTLYSLAQGKEIPLADSASTDWDFGINFASLIFNSHASGPGQAGVIMVTGDYETYNMVPTTGFSYDTTSTQLAINSTPFSPNAWYVYDPVSHAFSPKAGLFFAVRTADGHYAKLEILSVTYANYTPGAMYPDNLLYKFRYVYQKNGSVNLN